MSTRTNDNDNSFSLELFLTLQCIIENANNDQKLLQVYPKIFWVSIISLNTNSYSEFNSMF